MKILSKIDKLSPLEMLAHTLCMFGLGVVWLSTFGTAIINPKIIPGFFWEISIYMLYLFEVGSPRMGIPTNGPEFGDLFTIWGIISRYWWLSIAPSLTLIYFVITRER